MKVSLFTTYSSLLQGRPCKISRSTMNRRLASITWCRGHPSKKGCNMTSVTPILGAKINTFKRELCSMREIQLMENSINGQCLSRCFTQRLCTDIFKYSRKDFKYKSINLKMYQNNIQCNSIS